MNKDTLPQGDNIRQLLVKSSISEASINSFLKDKGVFLGHAEKNSSVPLLMKTLVSPDDFGNLYEIQKTKEESIKHNMASIKCNTDFVLSEVFNSEIDINQAIKNRHTYRPDYKVVGKPCFYFESRDSASINYKIERENALNDWTSNKTYHDGSLRIEKDSSGTINVGIQQNSTSKETNEVNSIIVSYIKKRLRDESLIKSGDDFESIRFNHFHNTNRIKFLYSFATNFSIYTKFKSLSDLNLYLDAGVKSHADLENFLAEIENLRLKGKGLQNHIFIKTAKYQDKLQFASIYLKYDLNYKGIKGTMNLDLSFPEFIKNRNPNSEFQIQINFSLGNIKKRASTENAIRKELLTIIDRVKIDKYNSLKMTSPLVVKKTLP